ncbi:MAG: hypothetical protein J6W13_08210 [Salinivirgaceae bacterium]|nr:hypothetical protein [Salinivirgaceae bacterium]
MEDIKCPLCGKRMKEYKLVKKTAKTYEDCIRKCLNCEIGASNAKNNSTYIYKDYQKNVPEVFLEGLDETLKNANNVRNRPSKKIKFGYSTSEDAFSWIFTKYFIHSEIEGLKNILGLEDGIEEILMWGVPQITKQQEYQKSLIDICKQLGERKNSYSEPDIIVISKSEIIFIEVKLKSSNDKKEIKDDKYFVKDYYADWAKAKNSKCYELVRNWTIGNLFAKGKSMRLINLAPESTLNDKQLEVFENSLKDPKRFQKMSWKSVFSSSPGVKTLLQKRYDAIVK